jgi:putative ABC transport system substrate-binding protein
MSAATPLVFVEARDPVKIGLVESLNRPGGSMTGIYMFTADLEAKRLSLLRDVVPTAATFGVLVNPNFSIVEDQLRDVQDAAARLNIRIVVARANSEGDFDAAFSTLIHQGAAAVQVCASPFFNSNRDRLVALAAHYKMPTIYRSRAQASRQ